MRKLIYPMVVLILVSTVFLVSCDLNGGGGIPTIEAYIWRYDATHAYAYVYAYDSNGDVKDLTVKVDNVKLPWNSTYRDYEFDGLTTANGQFHELTITGAGLDVYGPVSMPAFPNFMPLFPKAPENPIEVSWYVGMCDYATFYIAKGYTVSGAAYHDWQSGYSGVFTIPGGTLIASDNIPAEVDTTNGVLLGGGVSEDSFLEAYASGEIQIDTIP